MMIIGLVSTGREWNVVAGFLFTNLSGSDGDLGSLEDCKTTRIGLGLRSKQLKRKDVLTWQKSIIE